MGSQYPVNADTPLANKTKVEKQEKINFQTNIQEEQAQQNRLNKLTRAQHSTKTTDSKTCIISTNLNTTTQLLYKT